MKRPIYLDYNSTTPLDPRVFDAMRPYFLESFGNASSSTHAYGWEAEEVVARSRESIVRAIGAADKRGLIFTSGATESNNLVIKGIARASSKRPLHMITQETEHKCVLDSLREIEKEGHEASYLKVDSEGRVDPEDVRRAIKKNTVLCSVMVANNEIGTIQPIREISKICHNQGVLFHTDAVQAVGKIPVDVGADGIDLLSISGHKIYGPKGIGALYVAPRVPPISLAPLLHGGGHEGGHRSGTLNVPGIVGLAKALELCSDEIKDEPIRLQGLRDHLTRELLRQIPDSHLNGHPTERLPNNVNVSFDYVRSDDLIMAVPEIAISSGSACTSGTPEPSYVIRAISHDDDRVNSAIRIGLGRWTTAEQVEKAIEVIVKAVRKLRSNSPRFEMREKRQRS